MITSPAPSASIDNPGAVPRQPGVIWQGEDASTTDPRLVVFNHPQWGIRTIARALITYQDARRTGDVIKLATVSELVDRWKAQIGPELSAIGIDPSIDVYQYATMDRLVRAVIAGQLGEQPYPDSVINRGLLMAGILRADAPDPDRSLWQTFTGKVNIVQVFSGLMAATAFLAQAADIMRPLASFWPWVAHLPIITSVVLGLLTLLSKSEALRRQLP